MLKLTCLGTITLAITACLPPTLHGQTSYQYEYVGPLDAIQSVEKPTVETSPLANIVANESLHRVASLVPPTKILPFKAITHRLNAQPITKQTTLAEPPLLQLPPATGNKTSAQSLPVLKPTLDQTIPGEALPINNEPPVFAEPVTPINDGRPEFTEPVTETRSFPVTAAPVNRGFILPAPQDPTRFGYRDGQAFGFDNSRLYHPLEGPQLNLQGAPTYDFGPPGCDEWAGFGRHKNLEHQTACGGLKTNPGHLGIPWLGSNENCDQTTTRPKLFPLKKPRLSCKKCQAKENYDSSCSTCSSGNGK